MDHLEPSVVNNQIFPPLTSGFTDTEFIIREQTVKVYSTICMYAVCM